MTERNPGRGEEVDLATIARDDHLLDVLGRGEPAPEGDDLAAMLAAWRDDLGETVDDQPAPPLPAPAARTVRAARLGRRMVGLAAAVVALVVIATGLGIGSRDAGPASPLWALTRVLYPEQADVRLVETAIREARGAAADGRLDEAWNLMDQARRQLGSVEDPDTVRRLTADLDALQRELVAVAPTPAPPTGTPAPSPSAAPSAPTSAGPVEPKPAPSEPAPAASPTKRSPLDLPLPQLPLPSPSANPNSPSLPGLPLPTISILDPDGLLG